jgi:hypothetical protein
MFFMAAHGLYFILVPLMALLPYLEIWPTVQSARFSAIIAALGIRSQRPTSKDAYPDAHRTGTYFIDADDKLAALWNWNLRFGSQNLC